MQTNIPLYKARILNARMKLFSKITDSIIQMNMERGFDFPYHYFYCAQEIGYIVQYLMEVMVNNHKYRLKKEKLLLN